MKNREEPKFGKKFMKRFKSYLHMEIVIDYKTCVYFFSIWFFYCVYLLCIRVRYADILYMFEMMAAAYLISYVQVYLFHNFDEASQLGKKDVPGIVFCTGLYTGVSYVLAWFDRNLKATLLFGAYILFMYYIMYLVNKIKRAIDTENLNKMLAEFKKGEARDGEQGKHN